MADAAASTRATFDPVDTTFDPSDVRGKDDVESPSLSSSNALARFEFEPGKSREGTKVLMVEWEDDEATRRIQGDWEVRWEGKRTVFPAREQWSSNEEGEIPVNRLYFLLGPGMNIPTTIRLCKGSVTWKTSPLPAIFSPELGATARQAGRKGVLHTIWAKKRLQVLQREIESESRENVEGIGFEMAVAEKEWIEQNFGVAMRSSHNTQMASPTTTSPVSPRSPGGGRMADKLRGLKLATRSQDLGHNPVQAPNPLSPETADVAMGSFSSFAAIKGMSSPSSLAAKPAQTPTDRASKTMTPQSPPQSFARQQREVGTRSLDAISHDAAAAAPSRTPGEEKQDDLFALPMSPKSPAITSSRR